jgi:hypothetical protein
MTPRNFALIIGIVYLAAGVLGFVPALLRPAPDSAPHVGITAFYGYMLGLFAVNLLHNAVHLAIGAWGIAASRTAEGARLAAQSHSAAIDTIEEAVGRENIDCDFERLDGYLFVPRGGSTDVLRRELAASKRAGIQVDWSKISRSRSIVSGLL